MDPFHSTTFGIYALFVAALSIVLALVDMFGGALLPRTSMAPASPSAGKADTTDEASTPGHTRVMAAHRNAMANIIPFIFVMLLYVVLGGSTRWVIVLCGIYTVMRVAHAIAHIRHLQPWRTIVWIVGQLCFFVTVFQVVRAGLQIV